MWSLTLMRGSCLLLQTGEPSDPRHQRLFDLQIAPMLYVSGLHFVYPNTHPRLHVQPPPCLHLWVETLCRGEPCT